MNIDILISNKKMFSNPLFKLFSVHTSIFDTNTNAEFKSALYVNYKPFHAKISARWL